MSHLDPAARRALEQARRETARAVADLRAMTAAVNRQRAQFQRESDVRRAERAERARTGELGPDARRLQQRIDRGEVTFDQVVRGEDDHPNSVKVRQNIAGGLDRLRSVLESDREAREERAGTDRLYRRITGRSARRR